MNIVNVQTGSLKMMLILSGNQSSYERKSIMIGKCR